MLTANKIYEQYIKEVGTPFHIWLATEKELYSQKKGIAIEQLKDNTDFLTYLNRRYIAGGKGLWKRVLEKEVNKSEKVVKEEFNTVGQSDNVLNNPKVEPSKEATKAIDEKQSISDKVKQNIEKEQTNISKFMQKKALGMPMPITIGLGLITTTAIVFTVGQIIKRSRKKA